MKEKVSFNYKGKKISLEAKKLGFFSKGRGLMFSRSKNANALLFNFKKPTNLSLTGLFVFYDFYVVWLDEIGKVIEVRRAKSFEVSIRQRKKFSKIIEIPINKKYDDVLKLLVED